MIIELRGKKTCPTCGNLQITSDIAVSCDTCGKDITSLYKNSSHQAHETWITYSNNDPDDKKHYCNWSCFKNDMIKISNNEYMMNKFDNIFLSSIHKKSFKSFVNDILKEKKQESNNLSLSNKDMNSLLEDLKNVKYDEKLSKFYKTYRNNIKDLTKKKNEYLSLKLQKQLDVVKLIKLLTAFIETDKFNEINTLGLSIKWLDLTEILLKADGSWDKKPYLYHKYNVEKNKNEE